MATLPNGADKALALASPTANGTASALASNYENNNHKRANADNHDWLTVIPTILERRQLTCTEQTMESAKALQKAGMLGRFTQTNAQSHMSTLVETSLLDSFLEDDYDGSLHLMTLDDSEGKPVGFVFWRQLPEGEMKNWIHWDNLRQRLLGEQKHNNNHHHVLNAKGEEVSDKDSFDEEIAPSPQLEQQSNRRRMRQSIRKVRAESIRWLEVAASNDAAITSGSSDNNESLSLLKASISASMTPRQSTALLEGLAHSWVKIELLAVHPDYWKQHIGTLLLACAMYQAHQQGDKHMILHVAGGKENVPALRLYEKFGFMEVPQGTVFQKPDKDLFVLGHVGESLQRLFWPALDL